MKSNFTIWVLIFCIGASFSSYAKNVKTHVLGKRSEISSEKKSNKNISSKLKAAIPTSLGLQGSAVNESSGVIAMKSITNGFELYTSLKTGTYSFNGDATIAPTNITIAGASAPHRIRVDYTSGNPVVTVRRISRLILWAPWNQYTVGELYYIGNSSFKANNLTHSSLWGNGDDRYRFKIYFVDSNTEETFMPQNNLGSRPTVGSGSDFDLYPAINNNQWDVNKEFKIVNNYYNSATLSFNAEVRFSTTSNYTHYITNYTPAFTISDDLTIAGSAVEGVSAKLKKKSDGVFEYVGGLKAGDFGISGVKSSTTYNYTVSSGQVIAGSGNITSGTATLKPYYIKVDLHNQTMIMQEVTFASLFMSRSGFLGSDRIIMPYQGNGRFVGDRNNFTFPSADERYKFKVDLADGNSVYWGSLLKDNSSATPTPAPLFSVVNNDYDYSFKFQNSVLNQKVSVAMEFTADGNYQHKYVLNSTLPLDLIEFKAIEDNNLVKFNWKTENEVNVKEFKLEKSTDGKAFIALKTVPAKNTTVTNFYTETDLIKSAQTLYYRLNMIDLDGTSKHSKLISFKPSNLVKDAFKLVYGNGNGNLDVSYPVANKNAQIKVYRLDGQLLKSIQVTKGATNSSIDVNGIANGVYVVSYNDEVSTYSGKFIK